MGNMDIQWIISPEDVARVTALIKRQSEKSLGLARRRHSLANRKPPVTRERF